MEKIEKPGRKLRICKWCGTLFVPKEEDQQYCCEQHERKGKKLSVSPQAMKAAKTVEEIAILAAEKGMSYGEYVGKYQV